MWVLEPQHTNFGVHDSAIASTYVLCLVAQSRPTLCDPMDYSPARLFCPWRFFRQEYWSGLPCPPPGDLPNPGIEPMSPTLQVDSLLSEPLGLKFGDENNEQKVVYMGCYGIGVSRVMGVIAEKFADDKGLVWLRHLKICL